MIPLLANYSTTPESDIPVPPEFLAARIIAPLFTLWAKHVLNSADVTSDQYSITSRARSLAHNAEVGGLPDSAHLYGIAMDIVPADSSARSAIIDAWPGTAIDEGDHLHLNISRAYAWKILLFALLGSIIAGASIFALSNLRS